MKETIIKLTDAKREIIKSLKDENEAVVVVKIYDDYNEENTEQSYYVEIQTWIGEGCSEYGSTWIIDRYYENGEKDAIKRSKAILKSVKGWFLDYKNIIVCDEVDMYS